MGTTNPKANAGKADNAQTQSEETISGFIRDVSRKLKENKKGIKALKNLPTIPAAKEAQKLMIETLEKENTKVIELAQQKVRVELEKILKED